MTEIKNHLDVLIQSDITKAIEEGRLHEAIMLANPEAKKLSYEMLFVLARAEHLEEQSQEKLDYAEDTVGIAYGVHK